MNEQERRLSSKFNFDILEVIEKCKDDTDPNHDAWFLLLQSMTPSYWLTAKKHIRKGTTENVIYPITREECDEMEERLALAEYSQKIEDEKFSSVLSEMKSIVEWSKKRHFNCPIILLICFFISLSIFAGPVSNMRTESWENDLECINSWEDKDTTVTLEESYNFSYSGNSYISSPTIAKCYYLHDVAKNIYWDSIKIEGSTNEDEISQTKIQLEENRKEFERRSAMTTKEIKSELIDYYEGKISDERTPSNIVRSVSILILILYIFSCNQYGYNISRFAQGKKSKNKLLSFAGIYFSSVLLAQTYSVGNYRYYRKEDAGVKIGFLVLGFALMMLLSAIILIKLTFNGIYYNYIEPWKKTNGDKIFKIENAGKGTTRLFFYKIANVISRGYINMFTMEGRDNRLQFLIFFAANSVFLSLIISIVGVNYYMVPIAIVFLAALFSTTIKRIHDIGKTGKYALLYFFPYLGIIGFFILLFYKGNNEENEYGEVPENVF